MRPSGNGRGWGMTDEIGKLEGYWGRDGDGDGVEFLSCCIGEAGPDSSSQRCHKYNKLIQIP